MKVLIFNGSPRKHGETQSMISYIKDNTSAIVEVIDTYSSKVSPCIDCRYCWKIKGCSIQDDMQSIYELVEVADVIIFASPVYFHCVSGPLKVLIDRFQVYWAHVMRKEEKIPCTKKAFFLLTGGAPKYEQQFTAAKIVLKGVLKDIGASYCGSVELSSSDTIAFKDNQEVINKLQECLEVTNL